ncbi:hypothetical protein [Coleofasciculus sp. FACHB-T130]|uniref:hypothetical protein n=1 Tax=Cyanophyceae TaxID=3028117 RepID=UPI001684C5F8|nr:hypothetical protein [Coleofasciculus sp. FACHB-T130]MBD1880944.1 hypothetical protein [Coleofasciculus sp. FACHB-T130]
MEALIEEIVRKLHHLLELKILEVLDFVEFLTWNKERAISQQVESDVTSQEEQEFEAIANQVADEFASFVRSNPSVLSDYAVSRVGIYEEHP